ncbi:hypothetical protein EJB05_55882, partial [Eragrostis curvula]
MTGAQDLPLQLRRPVLDRPGTHRFLALLGASMVVLFVVSTPPVHAGYALAGFLVWLLGMARLLLFGQIRQRPPFPGELESTTAYVSGGEAEEPSPA